MSHGARRITVRDFDELRLRVFISEGMQQSDASLERFLRSRRTGNWKVDVAKLLRCIVMMRVHFIVESNDRLGVEKTSASQKACQNSRDMHFVHPY
jgi:hypothetical protein